MKQVIKNRPYRSFDELEMLSSKIWNSLNSSHWLEAFAQHPQIGNLPGNHTSDSNAARMSALEQSGTANASDDVLKELASKNKAYFEKFGYIFIICATGKQADEILKALNLRLSNNKTEEIFIAANEQNEITKLRLKKLIE